MTYAKCTNCSLGPSGIEGHGDLFTQSITRGLVHFRCRACSCAWYRHYTGNGGFLWAMPAGEFQGMNLPGIRESAAEAM